MGLELLEAISSVNWVLAAGLVPMVFVLTRGIAFVILGTLGVIDYVHRDETPTDEEQQRDRVQSDRRVTALFVVVFVLAIGAGVTSIFLDHTAAQNIAGVAYAGIMGSSAVIASMGIEAKLGWLKWTGPETDELPEEHMLFRVLGTLAAILALALILAAPVGLVWLFG